MNASIFISLDPIKYSNWCWILTYNNFSGLCLLLELGHRCLKIWWAVFGGWNGLPLISQFSCGLPIITNQKNTHFAKISPHVVWIWSHVWPNFSTQFDPHPAWIRDTSYWPVMNHADCLVKLCMNLIIS